MANSNFFETDINENINKNYVLTVTQLNEYAESLLNCDTLLRNLSIEGEISGFKRYAMSGHCYFTLKDRSACVKCVMFKGYAGSLAFQPLDGMRVIISGYVSIYVKEGQFQFYVESMRSVGAGELYRRYIEIKNSLEAEGLFSDTHKKELPKMPKTIGIVTSKSGAVLHDIVSVTRRRFKSMNIVFTHCAVQGDAAAPDIASAIRRMDAKNIADVIIVGRGGGSMEDLWCFNDECVARAIYECKTPIISAVGHETDYTIADFVADLRAPTPSAAAELAVPLLSELTSNLEYAIDDVNCAMQNKLLEYKHRFSSVNGRIVSPDIHIKLCNGRVEMLENRAKNAVCRMFDAKNAKFNGLMQRLDALSPFGALKRGYTIAMSDDGKLITSANDMRVASSAKLLFSDGAVFVRTCEPKEKQGGDS